VTAPNASERGAALITALLIIAVMSAVIVALMDDIRYSVRRSANTDLRDQAMWYALGAEQFALIAIERDRALDPERSLLAATPARDFVFEIEGGAISGSIADQTNCFNVNALVSGRPLQRTANAEAMDLYADLLEHIGLPGPQARELAASAADWLDSDGSALSGGAEDAFYISRSPAYRAANGPMAELEELRAVRGYEEAVFRQIRPCLCATPDDKALLLNANTLQPGDEALLMTAVGETLERDGAESVIASRPDTGYPSLEDFWADPALQRIRIPVEAKGRVGPITRYYALEARVTHHGAEFELSALLDAAPGREPGVLSRRFNRPS